MVLNAWRKSLLVGFSRCEQVTLLGTIFSFRLGMGKERYFAYDRPAERNYCKMLGPDQRIDRRS